MARTQQSPHTSPAPTGSEFVREITALSETQRESAILEQALEGNFPTFLRHSEPVTLTGHSAAGDQVSITLCVSPDYLAIGSDTDYLYVPMRLRTAIAVANHYDSLLPTRRMVDAIYSQAVVHLAPQPLPAGAQPLTSRIIAAQDAILITTDHTAVDYNLIAEHAKLIIDSRGVYRKPRTNVVKA